MSRLSSILLLICLTTSVAVFIYLLQNATDSPTLFYALLFLAPFACYVTLAAAVYVVMSSVGGLGKTISGKMLGATSPFATDRLPSQLVAPKEPEDAK